MSEQQWQDVHNQRAPHRGNQYADAAYLNALERDNADLRKQLVATEVERDLWKTRFLSIMPLEEWGEAHGRMLKRVDDSVRPERPLQ